MSPCHTHTVTLGVTLSHSVSPCHTHAVTLSVTLTLSHSVSPFTLTHSTLSHSVSPRHTHSHCHTQFDPVTLSYSHCPTYDVTLTRSNSHCHTQCHHTVKLSVTTLSHSVSPHCHTQCHHTVTLTLSLSHCQTVQQLAVTLSHTL